MNYLLIYKSRGLFYNAYDVDAYILNTIFGYKVLTDKRKCGFPESVIEKVKDTLENRKISYRIIYFDKEPIEKNFKKLNKYGEYYNKAIELLDKQKRIDIIIEKLKYASEDEIERIIKAIEYVSN